MQRELVAVGKEETRNLVFDGFGKSARAAGDDGNATNDSFRADHTQRLGRQRRCNEGPGGFELPIDAGGGEPPRKGEQSWRSRASTAFYVIPQRAITHDCQARLWHVRIVLTLKPCIDNLIERPLRALSHSDSRHD
jgi:hypothetical protein